MSNYFKLQNTLKGSNCLLEENEFKIILAILDEREVQLTQELSPLAQLVLHVFDQKTLTDQEFYEVEGRFAKNRTQLLKILSSSDVSNPFLAKITIQKFG